MFKKPFGLRFVLLVVASIYLLQGCVFGQSTVTTGSIITADSIELFGADAEGRQRALITNWDKVTQEVAIIKTPYERAIARAYKKGPFAPPVSLKPTNRNDGEFYLSEPGEWWVEVFELPYTGQSEWLEVSVGGSPTTDIPDPETDTSAIYTQAKELIAQVNDPTKAKQYGEALSKVDYGATLESAKQAVSDVRKAVFVGRIQGKWYLFFEPINETLGTFTTLKEYTAAVEAVAKALNEAEGTAQQLPETPEEIDQWVAGDFWTPPPGPWVLGQRHNGRTYRLVCYGNRCVREWVDNGRR